MVDDMQQQQKVGGRLEGKKCGVARRDVWLLPERATHRPTKTLAESTRFRGEKQAGFLRIAG